VLIEIKGVQFVNKGAELMLHAIIKKIEEFWPEAEICMFTDSNSPYIKRAKIGAYQKLIFRKNVIDLSTVFYFFPTSMRNYFKNKWGVVTEADIDLILDASGFNYGDQWSPILLKQAAIEASRMNKKGKHYIFLPQALGPFTNASSQQAAKEAFENATLVYAREDKSLSYAKKCTDKAQIAKSCDFTNLIIPEVNAVYENFIGKIAVIPNCQMVSNKNKNLAWKNNYEATIAEVIKAFQQAGQEVFFLNHEGKSDLEICHRINSTLNQKLAIVEPSSPIAVKSIIAHSKVTVCSRYHGCISALSSGVPCIGTSWSHKYEQLFGEYGVEDLLLSSDMDKNKIIHLVNYVLDQELKIKAELKPYLKKYKEDSTSMWNSIKEVIDVQ